MVHFVKLRLSGFKSFVEPSELVIEPGTTGIVGPNGCGKSNLVEALRWVMGETSAKRMRGSEMEDVIFGGTAGRPARNFAEVLLTLDNSDRRAPLPFNEQDVLEVTRRIERDRGSLYRINGREVRARDVQLLFADNATGAQSTAIVSQGRVGALINARPADRRHLLEEAAGISGLHSRRHEAELRLRAAETNLERLEDVIGTLESQLNQLRRQVRQATRYRNIAQALRRQEAMLLYLELLAGREAERQAAAGLEQADASVRDLARAASAAEERAAQAQAAVPPLREADQETAAALQRLMMERDALRREAKQVQEARARAEQRLQQLSGDLARALTLGRDAEEAIARLEQEACALEEAAAREP
ncbi:MAG TPA: AAA family ATPase, partial [Kiloniellales bacterium]|nr:AAA family ATPase [Kiloniellales bacterium]